MNNKLLLKHSYQKRYRGSITHRKLLMNDEMDNELKLLKKERNGIIKELGDIDTFKLKCNEEIKKVISQINQNWDDFQQRKKKRLKGLGNDEGISWKRQSQINNYMKESNQLRYLGNKAQKNRKFSVTQRKTGKQHR